MGAGRILAMPRRTIASPWRVVHAAVLADYLALTKPEVSFVIGITTAAAFILGVPLGTDRVPWWDLLHTVVGTVLVAGGAAALNQWMERRFDARMRRTARRPVAAGRIEPRNAMTFGISIASLGLAELFLVVGPLPTVLALGTLLAYLLVYTPLKRVTPLCTLA